MSKRDPRDEYREMTDEEILALEEVDDIEFAPPGELTTTISVRMNDEELHLFSAAAEAANQPFSTFLKAAARRDIERSAGTDLAAQVADEVVKRLEERERRKRKRSAR